MPQVPKSEYRTQAAALRSRADARTLRLGLGVLAGLCWIVALEWLFGSLLSLAAN